MILPIIGYGSVIYDTLPLILINWLDNIHRRATTICSGAQPRTETSKLLEDLGWTRLKVRRTYLKMLHFFYKIYAIASPRYLNSIRLELTWSPNPRTTRNPSMGKLYQHEWRTVKYKNSFFPSAIADWNKILVDLVPNDSLSKFEKYINNKFFTDNRFFYCNRMRDRIQNFNPNQIGTESTGRALVNLQS